MAWPWRWFSFFWAWEARLARMNRKTRKIRKIPNPEIASIIAPV
jgi:hypothetical protein